jgi:hypothetical protein
MKEVYNKVLDDLLKKVRAKGLPQEDELPDNMIDMQQEAMMEERKSPDDKVMETMPDDLKQQMAADNLQGEEDARMGDESEEYDPSMLSDDSMSEMDDMMPDSVMIPEEPDEIKTSIMDLLGPCAKSDKKTVFGGAMSTSTPKKSRKY